jgi:hypothetical protein
MWQEFTTQIDAEPNCFLKKDWTPQEKTWKTVISCLDGIWYLTYVSRIHPDILFGCFLVFFPSRGDYSPRSFYCRGVNGTCPGVSPGVTVAGDEVSQGEAEAREMESPDEWWVSDSKQPRLPRCRYATGGSLAICYVLLYYSRSILLYYIH